MQIKKKILNSKYLFLGLIALLSITGCGPSSSVSGDPTTSENPGTSLNTEITTNPSSDGSTTTNPTSEETVTTNPTTEIPEGPIDFSIYTLNDFHGATKYVEDSYPQIGLAKLSTVFRSFAEQETSFFISSGDMWQETIESNLNHGEYVTKAFNKIGLDAMAVGNHEFDWGSQWITKNSEVANYPFLAANIVEKSTGELIEGVQKSTLIEKGGVKVGVIGVIGPAQYNSISYQYVAQYDFESEYNIVCEEAEILRQNGADLIVLSSHDGWSGSDFTVLKKDMINDAKIDMVIAGHTHTLQNQTYTRSDGKVVPMVQAYSRGTAYGHVNFTLEENGDLTLNSYAVKNFQQYTNVEEDQEILDLYKNNYDVDDFKVEEICTTTAEFSKSQAAIMASTAIYEKIISLPEYDEYNILTAYHNSTRQPLVKGSINYEQLFASFPFDNEIIIFKVSSSYVKRGYNYVHSGFDTNANFSGSRYVAGIDYLAYKTVSLEDGIRTGLYVRDIVKEYLKKEKVVTPSNYVN